ncbi:MAG: hypothetical protein A2508_02575 [Candidatus Lambdaproteobacteria bacterium RIFOXYD12_FULL_49_8]|uniref:Uncharacterized protein n=1 Tax=Candidatus Lambdaproteobacteria bacterium RIFOXYD2_FULL_50_16 TaxID=1817772 RepID=A0A1F6G883_9PROT|nr:MAG: hypothetical protein A2527_00545 [Candidatus Lambdaproteobacteria bacterium RIFOXYD2_FULL_50_16]OGG98270.1 MAG: hypothetical protein A2508_02575 [Candidatus Lambdaproteobacteria bacterium RIFOXYD12_FULL_49_8]
MKRHLWLLPLLLFLFAFSAQAEEDWEKVDSTKDAGYSALSKEGKLKHALRAEYRAHGRYYKNAQAKIADLVVGWYEAKDWDNIKTFCGNHLHPTAETDELFKKGKGGAFYHTQWFSDQVAKKVGEIGMTAEYEAFKNKLRDETITCFIVAGAVANNFIWFCENPSPEVYQHLKEIKAAAEEVFGRDTVVCERLIKEAQFSK